MLGAYLEAYHLGPRRLELRHHRVQPAGARATGPVLRIVHLSDIQTHVIGAHERRAVTLAMAQRPDLILLTGDYLHPRREPLPAETRRRFRELMDVLGARLGVFAVPGDVEGDSCAVFAGTRVECLADAVRVVSLGDGRRLGLVGLAPGTSRRPGPRLARLLARVSDAELRVVMSHAPDFVAALPEPAPVELVLAGHTHGGQVVLPGFGPLITLSRLPRRYAGGLHSYRGVALNVSRGIGMERGLAPQIRFLCPPELSVIDLVWRDPAPGLVRAAGG